MSRVLTFSRAYPAYHPKKGNETFFVEKIVRGLHRLGNEPWDIEDAIFSEEMYYIVEPKWHTIRAGNRWKAGDKFSPRVWSGKPYASKQIIIAPDIEIKSVQDIKIEVDKDYVCILIDNWPFFEENKNMVTQIEAFETLAKNDGLTLDDLKAWFKYPKPFTGQIICWNESINY